MATSDSEQRDTERAEDDLEETQTECACRKSLDQNGECVGVQWRLIKGLLSVPLACCDLLGPVDVTTCIAHQLNDGGELDRLKQIHQPQKKCYQANTAQ